VTSAEVSGGEENGSARVRRIIRKGCAVDVVTRTEVHAGVEMTTWVRPVTRHFVPVGPPRRESVTAPAHVIVVTEVWRSIAGKHPRHRPKQWDERHVTVATTFKPRRYVRYANARAPRHVLRFSIYYAWPTKLRFFRC